MKALATSVALILLAGCASQYTQPDSAQPSAPLRLVSSLDGTFNAQTFVAYGDDACTRDGPDFGILAGFNWAGDRGPDNIVRVRPDQRLFVKAAAQTLGKLTVNLPTMIRSTTSVTSSSASSPSDPAATRSGSRCPRPAAGHGG